MVQEGHKNFQKSSDGHKGATPCLSEPLPGSRSASSLNSDNRREGELPVSLRIGVWLCRQVVPGAGSLNRLVRDF